MKPKHTPGPWKVGTGWVMGPGNQAEPPICYKSSTAGSIERDTANLTLIAAAPEMLECLKRFVSHADLNDAMDEITFQLVLSAIAKAEGWP